MIVTLLTDFGVADHFVGVMKGVILGVDARITLVDLSHDVRPGEVEAAAFLLLAAYPYFPPGTVHVAVVDPGVGTERRPLVVGAADQFFVGPDNGLFSYLLEHEPDARVVHVVENDTFRQPVSATFHGRDIFAPVGAALATGARPESFGPLINDPVRLRTLRPQAAEDGSMRGRILHVDRFGNCITSFSRHDLPDSAAEAVRLRIGRTEIRALRRQYEGEAPGVPFAVWGSAGFLEVSINGASAALALGTVPGDPVTIVGSTE